MLSSPSKNLQARQRATHRRQNSTPSAFEAAKIPALPNVQQRQRVLGHRRGLSLDTRRQPTASPTTTTPTAITPTRQDFSQVSTNTNTGLATTTPQHVLREAQQQRIQARPGHRQNNSHLQPQQNFMSAGDCENYLMSPHGTPQQQRFDPSCFNTGPIPFDPQNGSFNVMMAPNCSDQTGFAGAMMTDKDFELFGTESPLSTPSFMNFHDSPNTAQSYQSDGDSGHSRRSSRRISNGIMDRVAKFENMGGESVQRPATPPHQNANNYFPPTPMDTPHDRMSKQEPPSRPNRFSEGYDESMEETLKPTRSKPNQRTQTIFEEMRRRAEENPPQTPPQPNRDGGETAVDGQVPTADFMNMNNFNSEFLKLQDGFDGFSEDLHHSDMSQHSTPHTPNKNMHHPNMALFDSRPNLRQAEPSTASPATPSRSPHRPSDSQHTTPHRRTESLASVTSAASISDINIEETKTETGVTLDEIATYISGPEAADNKWVCVYEECGKRFGRKENIKSHVQTHLNDRQYQCPSCSKCFVRQHDLKRHAKIHTGIKPYPCECGNSFARHDALTRHRQRGMCVGAFDGIVKKVVKRGRPRKHRPEMDDRVNKSARTRNKNSVSGGGHKAGSSNNSVSSQSGYSDASTANSPENFNSDFNAPLDNHGQSFSSSASMDMGFDMDMELDMNIKQESSQSVAPMPSQLSMSSAPMPSIPSHAPIDASEQRQKPLRQRQQAQHHPHSDVAPSPSAASPHSFSAASSYVSPEEVMELPQSLPPHHSQNMHHNSSTFSSPSPAVKSEHGGSQYNTPPELSQSSSPPPSSSNHPFGADEINVTGNSQNAHNMSDLSAGVSLGNGVDEEDDSLLAGMRAGTISSSSSGALVAPSGATAGAAMGFGYGLGGVGGMENDDELLMKAFAAADDTSGLGACGGFDRSFMGKFDEFDDAVDMFTNGDDVFFGTS